MRLFLRRKGRRQMVEPECSADASTDDEVF
jgi:hypothetical protein